MTETPAQWRQLSVTVKFPTAEAEAAFVADLNTDPFSVWARLFPEGTLVDNPTLTS